MLVIALQEAVVDEADWQRDQHDATHHTHPAQHSPRHRDGVHVTVAHRCHGDDHPPAGRGDAVVVLAAGLEVQAVLQQLGQRAEDGRGHAHEHQQHDQLAAAVLQRQTQRLQAVEVARQLDEPEDARHAQHAQHDASALHLQTLTQQRRGSHRHVVRADGQEVDDVQWLADELTLVSGEQEAHNALCGEPADARGLNDPGDGGTGSQILELKDHNDMFEEYIGNY